MMPQHIWIIYYYAFHLFLVLCLVPPLLILKTEAANLKVCGEGVVSPDPDDCASYFQCLDGAIIKEKCSSGSYFDSSWDVCVIDVDGICTPATVNCTEGELEVNPFNSCGYLKCLNGSITAVNCTSGSYFNSTLMTCIIDENGICSAIDNECIEGEIEENPEDPCGYLKCVNGSLEDVDCTSGTYFNSSLNICLIDEKGICSAIDEECTEGEIEESPDDPCVYLQCVDGSLEEVNCTRGTYFNSSLNICLIDEDGICSGIDEKCTEGEIEENHDDPCGYLQCVGGSLEEVNCTSGTYFNSSLNICLIDEKGICSAIDEECIEGEIEENPDDPCGYLQCVDGSLEEVNCTSGTYFNSSLNICLIDENGICSGIDEKCTEGEIEENHDDPCGYLQCVGGSLEEVNCTSGTYFNSSLNICLIDEKGICSAINEECTKGEIEENPDDPCGYLQCVDGSLEEVNCTSGTYFNSSLNICLIDENGICSGIDEKCTEGEIEENHDDPCGYLQCVGGSLEEVNCTRGTYFNSSLNICLIDENGICSGIDEKCTEGEIEENHDDPCGYLQCVGGSLEEVNCTSGTYFNSSLNICLIDEKGICSAIDEKCIEGEIEENPDDPCGYLQCADGSLKEVNCTSGTYFNSSLNICLIDENGMCSTKCTEGEIEENPDDPCGYLQCADGSLKEVNCTSGTYFNSSLNICLIDENGMCSTKCTEGEIEENPDDPCGYLQCADGSLKEVNCTSGTYFNSSLNICLIDENGMCSTKCTEGEIEENPDDPCGYLQCADGSLKEVNCTSGTYFNSSLNICLIDENGMCSTKCTEGEIEENPDDPCGYLQCADGSLKEVNCTSGTYFNSSLNICLIDENGMCSTKCTEGEIEENPDDPCGYLQCADGSLKEVNCTSGTYFNSSLNICLIDENGICSTKCTEGEIEENPDYPCGYLQCADGSLEEVNCTSGTYFNSSLNICLIDENGICSLKCTEGEIEENPDDPCGYLQCVDGSLEEVNCTSGTYFNSSLNICLIDENGICSLKCTEGEIEENPDDPCGYLQCVDGSLEEVNCTSGTYFNSSLNICLIDENGICSLKCTEGEIEENPDDPCGYLQCVDGSLEEVNCTSGTYFNSSLNICLIDENGICSSKCTEGEIEENPDYPCGYLQCADGSLEEVNCTSGTYFNSSLNICLIDENGICSLKCTEGEIEENPDDPCGYLQCVDGSLKEVNCTSGTYFNSSLNICLIDENGICSLKCTEGEIEENPDDLCGYLRCINGNLEELNCTSGSYFNSSIKVCLIDENGICSAIPEDCRDGDIEENPDDLCGYLICKDGSFSEANCTSGSYFDSSWKTCIIDENGICSSRNLVEACIEDEIESDPEECAGYLQCIDGERVSQLCAYGSYFDAALKSCEIDYDNVCISKSEICEEGERKEDLDDTTWYFECINGDFVEQKCPEGSYFESSIKGCIIDENGVYIS